MATPRVRRIPAGKQTGTLRLIPRRPAPAPRPALATRPKFQFRRVGKIRRASSPTYNFTIRTIQNLNTGGKQVLLGRTNRQTGRTDWRMMSIIEYNHKVATKTNDGKVQLLTTSATMLAKHPDVFGHVGHEIAKNVLHILLAA